MKTKPISINPTIAYFKLKPLRIIFAILWIVFVYQIIASGFRADPYLLHVRGIPAPHPYPRDLVTILICTIILHITFLVTTDALMRSRWKYFLMLIITMPFLFYFAAVSMHAPPPLTYMVMWLLLSFLIFLALCIWQVLSFLYSKFQNSNSA